MDYQPAALQKTTSFLSGTLAQNQMGFLRLEDWKMETALGNRCSQAASGSPFADLKLPPKPERMAFSVKETAGVLGLSEKTVRRLVGRGLLRPSRALRHLLFSRKEVERFLAET